MRIKNKLLKLVLMFIVMLFILCISNNVKADFKVEHKPPMEPIDCDQPGGDGFFFCRNEYTPWNWYTSNASRLCIPDSKDTYENQGEIQLGPTISFGLHTLQAMGGSLEGNLATVQHLIWGSVKYGETTCEGGNASWYNGGALPIVRADQYGMFYYGVLGGGGNLELKVDEEYIKNAKVFIDQKEKTAIVGPYYMSLVIHNSSPVDDATVEQNLWDELAKKNKEAYGENLPAFAEYEIEIDGAGEKKIFLDEEGKEVKFPKFNKKFYIKFDLNKEAEKVHPKIKITYIKNAKGVAYGYISKETVSQVHTYAVTDMWYDGAGLGASTNGTAGGNHALDMVFRYATVRWYRSC